MSKQISSMNLAHIFSRLLLNANKEFDTEEQAEAFAMAAAQLVTEHCGGVVNGSSNVEGNNYISIIDGDSLPEDGGIWGAYDVEGDLRNGDHFVPTTEMKTAHLALDTFVICRTGAQDVANYIDTVWQVDFTEHSAMDFENCNDSKEWRYLMSKASFAHTEVGDLLLHVQYLLGEKNAPPVVRQLALTAHNMGMTWILFHLGQ